MQQQSNTHNFFFNLSFLVGVNINFLKFDVFFILFIYFAYFATPQHTVVKVFELKKSTKIQFCNIGDNCNANCSIKQAGDFCGNNLNMVESLFCDKLTK